MKIVKKKEDELRQWKSQRLCTLEKINLIIGYLKLGSF